MTTLNVGLVGNEFRVGYRLQKEWSWSMATAFFCGEVGAGLFFISFLASLKLGMLVGVLMVAIGKSSGHLIHLGRPSNAWRAIRNIRKSWVSRGLASIAVFAPTAALVVLDAYSPGLVPKPMVAMAGGLAMLAAMVIMLYQGLAMSHSPSIGLWSNGLMPVTSFTYAMLGGVFLALVLGWNQLPPNRLEVLQAVAAGLVLLGLVVVASLVHAAKYGPESGQRSAELLLEAGLKGWFFSLVIIVGFIVTGLLVLFGTGQQLYITIAAVTELAGYYGFRILVFKAATYDPILSFARHSRRR
jgi:DMSO reductase anchor subunit